MTRHWAGVHELSDGGPPTEAEVDRIVACPEPVVRNLQITHCYHELSVALAARTGETANWCTFAVWSSKQIGQIIRHENLDRAAGRLLRALPVVAVVAEPVVRVLRRHPVDRLVRQVVMAVARLDAVGDAAARGNQKVFAEIAHEFARFLAAFADDVTEDERRIAEFCAEFRPGEPPGGQRLLRQAFTRYHRAMFTDDPKQRAELVLLANLEIGLHEQTRLQPEIAAALGAPVVDPAELAHRFLDLVPPGVREGLRIALWPLVGRHPLSLAGEQLAEYVRMRVRRAATTHLLTLALPDGQVLDLGDDLPAEFAPVLAELSDPELITLFAALGPAFDSLLDTAARDWADLSDRMHYIAAMFRCFAQRADLFRPPFTGTQTEAIKSGRRPAGSL